MTSLGRLMFPYGMQKNSDGSWTLFNRNYKPVGVVTADFAQLDSPNHKVQIHGLGPSTLKKLDHTGAGEADRIYFYNDGSAPSLSSACMSAYLKKLQLLMNLKVATIG